MKPILNFETCNYLVFRYLHFLIWGFFFFLSLVKLLRTHFPMLLTCTNFSPLVFWRHGSTEHIRSLKLKPRRSKVETGIENSKPFTFLTFNSVSAVFACLLIYSFPRVGNGLRWLPWTAVILYLCSTSKTLRSLREGLYLTHLCTPCDSKRCLAQRSFSMNICWIKIERTESHKCSGLALPSRNYQSKQKTWRKI